MLFASLTDLNAQPRLFTDVHRSDDDNAGPFVIVCDDFYSDPMAVRALALQQQFFQYKPPLPEQVGAFTAAQYPDTRKAWESSALLRYLGSNVAIPERGFRYAPPDVKDRLAALVNSTIDEASWETIGDWWNGAFHLQYDVGQPAHRVIHHHYREGDVVPKGWSGVVYLTPDGPDANGTTIWQDKTTQCCIAPKGESYVEDEHQFELAFEIQNRFNRLVLFRENVLHRAGQGFGVSPDTARLTQTFFFQST